MNQSTHPMTDSSEMRESLVLRLIEILNLEEYIDTSIEQILQVIERKTGFDAVGKYRRRGP